MRNNLVIGVEDHKRLTSILHKYFKYLYNETTVHPKDLLHSAVGPFPLKYRKNIKLAWYLIKQLIRKKPCLPIQGFALTKK